MVPFVTKRTSTKHQDLVRCNIVGFLHQLKSDRQTMSFWIRPPYKRPWSVVFLPSTIGISFEVQFAIYNLSRTEMIPSPYKHFKAILLILGAAVLSGTAFIPSRTNEKQRKLTSLSTPQLRPQLSSTHNSQQHLPASVLRVVADPPMKEDEKKKEEGEGSFRDWIKSNNGGFIPNIRARLRRPLARGNRNSADRTQLSGEEKTSKPKPHQAPMVLEVNNIQDYKTQVVDFPDKIVCVRFYAPWCKACKAVEASFHRLSRKYLEVQFVEVPVTKENVYLHKIV